MALMSVKECCLCGENIKVMDTVIKWERFNPYNEYGDSLTFTAHEKCWEEQTEEEKECGK